jgi:hypothetical protein
MHKCKVFCVYLCILSICTVFAVLRCSIVAECLYFAVWQCFISRKGCTLLSFALISLLFPVINIQFAATLLFWRIPYFFCITKIHIEVYLFHRYKINKQIQPLSLIILLWCPPQSGIILNIIIQNNSKGVLPV